MKGPQYSVLARSWSHICPHMDHICSSSDVDPHMCPHLVEVETSSTSENHICGWRRPYFCIGLMLRAPMLHISHSRFAAFECGALAACLLLHCCLLLCTMHTYAWQLRHNCNACCRRERVSAVSRRTSVREQLSAMMAMHHICTCTCSHAHAHAPSQASVGHARSIERASRR
jgi:hypothetical protein